MTSSESSKYTSKLKGARVLVIGGSSGIGFGVAEALVEHGASVIISSSSQARVSKAIERLETSYPSAKGRVQGFSCNLGSQETLESEVAKLFAEVSKGGKLDHVVHTAGDALAIGKIEDLSLQQILQGGMVRFFSPFIVAQHLRKYLKQGPASSFTMTSAGASRPPKDWPVVVAYLAGLEGLSRSLAKDLAPIRVNLIGPGAVDTELWDDFRKSGAFEGIKAGFESSLATGTIGRVEDVVESYLYAMKDKNITGSMIRTEGGANIM